MWRSATRLNCQFTAGSIPAVTFAWNFPPNALWKTMLTLRKTMPTLQETIIEGTSMSAQSALPPFHLAFPVRDLAEARDFYGNLLGCPEGRSSANWVDFNFTGPPIVAHLQ